jgi:signal transduction histidine kinase
LIEDMVREGHRLDGLISQMLTVARVENRGLSYNLRRSSVGEVLETLKRASDNESVTIVGNDLAAETVKTDPQALVQLLLSLADNALTHGATKVNLEIHEALHFSPMRTVGESPRSGLYFLVRDNGPGIDPEFLPRAFDKFEKHSRSSGTGLGLYFARLMAEAIDACILVHTGPEGTVMAVAVQLLPAEGEGPSHSRKRPTPLVGVAIGKQYTTRRQSQRERHRST